MSRELYSLFSALQNASQFSPLHSAIKVVHRDRLHKGYFVVEWESDIEGDGPAYHGEGAYESDSFYTVPHGSSDVIPGTDIKMDWLNDRNWMIDPTTLNEIEFKLLQLRDLVKAIKEKQAPEV